MSDEEVLAAFMSFCNFGAGAQSPIKSGMDGTRFAKLCHETGLHGGRLNSIAVDIIFSKIKATVSMLCLRLILTSEAGILMQSPANLPIERVFHNNAKTY